ncbi:hypothetical protein EK21DRAFT_90270 [Setomelanomma holmii]|uniref:Uncharacterized protein n=1 Tax=Setomelanomma holmii TaxID=210430 RepID=A0A9P4LKN3_9PLEO|nr:hypothetical protein EK21DRAFT_90270 [Setomelanomma holmii]
MSEARRRPVEKELMPTQPTITTSVNIHNMTSPAAHPQTSMTVARLAGPAVDSLTKVCPRGPPAPRPPNCPPGTSRFYEHLDADTDSSRADSGIEFNPSSRGLEKAKVRSCLAPVKKLFSSLRRSIRKTVIPEAARPAAKKKRQMPLRWYQGGAADEYYRFFFTDPVTDFQPPVNTGPQQPEQTATGFPFPISSDDDDDYNADEDTGIATQVSPITPTNRHVSVCSDSESELEPNQLFVDGSSEIDVIEHRGSLFTQGSENDSARFHFVADRATVAAGIFLGRRDGLHYRVTRKEAQSLFADFDTSFNHKEVDDPDKRKLIFLSNETDQEDWALRTVPCVETWLELDQIPDEGVWEHQDEDPGIMHRLLWMEFCLGEEDEWADMNHAELAEEETQ